MTAVAWAIVFYTVATNTPTVGMTLVALIMVAVCTVLELRR